MSSCWGSSVVPTRHWCPCSRTNTRAGIRRRLQAADFDQSIAARASARTRVRAEHNAVRKSVLRTAGKAPEVTSPPDGRLLVKLYSLFLRNCASNLGFSSARFEPVQGSSGHVFTNIKPVRMPISLGRHRRAASRSASIRLQHDKFRFWTRKIAKGPNTVMDRVFG